jgi:DNA repair protein SbcD/Mre11
MRLLHTSDWHLGRSFHRRDLINDQAHYIDDLMDVVRSERVDLVVVAGDIYDRALPSIEAIAVCNDALRRLAAARVQVIVISGNHDSPRRLGFGADLIATAGVHLRTDWRRCDEPVLVNDRHGHIAVYGLPYLEPLMVADDLHCTERTHTAAIGAAVDRIRIDQQTRPLGTRSVVVAHAFVTGGDHSDSERDISVGGLSTVPRQLFDGFTYVALGHLHGPQILNDRIRYSGSPLPFSFSEQHHSKAMWLVDIDGAGSLTTQRVPCRVPRPLATITSNMNDLLTGTAWASYENHYLKITLTDHQRPREPMEQLRARFPHTLVLDFVPVGISDGAPSYRERVRGRTDLEVALDFVDHVRGRVADPEETLVFQQATEAVRRRDCEH